MDGRAESSTAVVRDVIHRITAWLIPPDLVGRTGLEPATLRSRTEELYIELPPGMGETLQKGRTEPG